MSTYIDLGACLPNSLSLTAGGFCASDLQGVPDVPDGPTDICTDLENCCERFSGIGLGHIYAGCLVDAHSLCCPSGGEGCCAPLFPDNCNDGSIICSDGDVCDKDSGLSVAAMDYCSSWVIHILFNSTEVRLTIMILTIITHLYPS
eukprot:UN13364